VWLFKRPGECVWEGIDKVKESRGINGLNIQGEVGLVGGSKGANRSGHWM